MVGFEMNDRRKIGIGLTGFGVLFTFLGIIFFFDKGLLAMGNILFVAGVMLTIGMKSTISFFLKPRNYKVVSFVESQIGDISLMGSVSLPIISGRVTTDVYWSALAFMSDYVVCRLLDDKIRLVKSRMFLLSESLCAWILLLWILSDVTQGSILFGAGFCLVIFGWAVVGMIIEAYGFILLFSGFWPTVVVFLYRVPVLGRLLQQPFLMSFFDRFTRTERRVPV